MQSYGLESKSILRVLHSRVARVVWVEAVCMRRNLHWALDVGYGNEAGFALLYPIRINRVVATAV
jgi:hypothetical protein